VGGAGPPAPAAPPPPPAPHDGDVVVGEATRRLVDALVTLEPLGSFALKGRAEAVRAHRVVSLETPAAATTAAFVGREEELERIEAVYEEAAVRAPATRLAVLLASAGLGKSRLIGEFGRRRGEAATVVVARCDAAGGATFAPLAEALRELLGIEAGASVDTARAAIEAALPRDDDGARVAAGVAALLTGSPATPEETFFVVRRLLAGIAGTKPVVLVIDDLQWAEPLLLDLVEHLVQWGAGVPLLVLVGARPELRDVRSSLVAPGGLVSDVVTLSGLDAGAAMRLAANVIGATDLPAAVAAKVLATSEGNPLFIGELVRMLVEEGALTREGDRWTAGTALATLEMPPTIHALLAARIERLRPDERTVLERAAVVGRHFSRSAVAALLPGAEADLDARLEALRRSELIERDTGWLLGEPVLRFHHVLIRDAAYRRLLKETRADLHERLADWIEDRIGDSTMVIRGAASPEQDETIGRHLEQAHQLRRELGTLGPDGKRLGDRAAKRLASAGRAALARDDVSLAAGLLGRALGCLEPDDTARADLALDRCEALLAAGDVTQAATAIDELGRFTSTSPRLHAWRTCFAGQLTVLTAPEALRATANEVAAAATQLAALGDAAGEATAHYVQALALARLGQVGGCEAALDRALAAARRAGDRRRANTVLAIAPLAALWGPSPVTRASGRCLDVVRVLRITRGAPAVEAVALSCQGVLEALRGRTDAAKRMIAAAREMVEELGIAQRLFETDAFAGLLALLEEDAAAAERSLRGAYDGFRDLGLGIDAARAAALLGRALLAQGRGADAEALSHESEALAGDDLKAAIAWRGVRAAALARRGEHTAAAELASTAVEIAAATDALLDHADARLALAVALRAAGRDREADAEERRAGELWEAKGATLLAERAGRRGATSDTVRAGSERPDAGAARAPVTPNLTVAMLARFDAAIANRDLDAVRATFREDFEEVDHTLGSRYGLDETMASMRGLLRSRDPRYHVEPLATLGPTLLLARRHSGASGATSQRYDVGPYENEVIQILEVDDQSLLARSEVFGCDHLGDAIARLYERHAELLPAGPAHDRAGMTARLVTAMLTPKSDRLEDVMSPDVQAVDHRTVGGGPGGGVELWSRWRSASDELIRESTYRVDDVLALGTEGLLRRTTESGTIRATGGTFTNTSLLLSAFGPDGRQARFEMFDVGHEAEALARFEELTARAALRRRPLRRVRPNAATSNAARIDAAIQARDPGALAATLSDDLHVIHHPTGATHGASGLVSMYQKMFRAKGLPVRHIPIATLGEALCLLRASFSYDGIALKSGGVTEPVEGEVFLLHQVDEHGRVVWEEAFGIEHLAEGVTRLYERHAELQPEGAARDRAAVSAHSVAVLAGPLDPERMATTWASTYRIVDHRVFGTWTARSGPEAQEHFRRQLDLAPDFAHRFEDVLALEPHALLVRETFHGTSRDSGGTFENRICAIYHLAPDGRQAGAEAFEAEQGAEALARFEELTASREPPRAPSRRARPNRATAMVDRAVAAINARDMPAFEQTMAEDFVYVHHATGVTFGKREQLAVFRSAFRAEHLAYRYEPLAVLGESLLLGREWFSVTGLKERVLDAFGPAEIHSVFVMEWDGEDRVCRMEIFAPDHLGDAVARLYERHAELLPDGPERTRAATTARSVAAVLEMADSDRWVGSCAPTVDFADHRTLGTWSGRGPDAMRQHLAALAELAENVSFDVADVLDLRPDAVLFRWSHTGTARQGGGRYERPFLLLPVFGADGQLVRFEFFDEDRTGEALARCDELTAARESPRPPARRVRPNRATALVDGTATAINARDMPAYERTLADEFVYVHHVTGATYGKREELAVWQAAFRAEALAFRYEPLAVVDESLVLAREWVSVVGLKERDFDAFGPAEIHDLFIAEEDGQGRVRRMEIFAPSRLGDAVARLYERHAELLSEGPARDRAAAVARSLAIIAGPIDLERWATALAPTVRFVDHRIFGTWAASDRAEALQHFRLQLDLAPDFAHRLDDVVAVEPHTLVVRDTYYGTARESGGAFENLLCNVWAFGTDGALARADIFEAEQTAEALAYVDELTTPASAPPPLARFENDASRHGATCVRLFAAGDYDTHRRLFAEQFRYHDRRRMALLELDYDRFEAFIRYAGDGRTSRVDFRTVATRGERLALWRAAIEVAGGDVGPSEIEFLNVTELDDRGLATAYVRFDPDDLDAAYAELDRRWETDSDWAGSLRALGDAITARDWGSIPALMAPSFVQHDHRRLSLLGTTRGAEAWANNLRTLVELAPDAVLRAGHARTTPRGWMLQSTWEGTREGGAFELPFVAVHEVDERGALVRADLYDLDQVDEAFARFEALSAERHPRGAG
jgi:ketosteroid isomerase-like protein/tetratricopeptide (TPR) repeat protein